MRIYYLRLHLNILRLILNHMLKLIPGLLVLYIWLDILTLNIIYSWLRRTCLTKILRCNLILLLILVYFWTWMLRINLILRSWYIWVHILTLNVWILLINHVLILWLDILNWVLYNNLTWRLRWYHILNLTLSLNILWYSLYPILMLILCLDSLILRLNDILRIIINYVLRLVLWLDILILILNLKTISKYWQILRGWCLVWLIYLILTSSYWLILSLNLTRLILVLLLMW